MIPSIGDTVLHYKLLSMIRQTKCSIVFRAFDEATFSQVAIKFIFVKDTNKKRIENEILCLKIVNSPLIIKCIESFDYHKICYNYKCVAMPLYEIGSLKNIITPQKPESEIKIIFIDILKAVKALHSQNIWHRDIKVENVLVSREGKIVLTDLGLAIKTEKNEMTEDFVGTLQYAAPEIIENEPYDKSVDIWSLGVTLYQMLSGGKHPFPLSPESALRRCISKAAFFFPVAEWRNISKNAKNLIDRMMVLDRKRRISIDEALMHPWIIE